MLFLHADVARFAIRAADAPAAKPASMLTTARTGHDWSIERIAASLPAACAAFERLMKKEK